MSGPIDPVRRALRARRVQAAQGRVAEPGRVESVGPREPEPLAPVPDLPLAGGAAFDAHLLGQDGEKRGLRAGKPALDSAKVNYNRAEWSGARDRRSRKGRIADTEI